MGEAYVDCVKLGISHVFESVSTLKALIVNSYMMLSHHLVLVLNVTLK